MSKSNLNKPLKVIKSIGINLLLASENKDHTFTLNSYSKSYDVKPKDLRDTIEYKHSISEMALAKQEKHWFLVCTEDRVELFKIENKTGKLTFMFKFQADFATTDANVNVAEYIYGNEYIATGGNDGILRVWKLKIDKKTDTVTGVEKPIKYTSHTTPITKIDCTFDHEIIASIGSPDERRCLIHDFKSGSLINELTFSEKADDENYAFYGCKFSLHRKYLYTLTSLPDRNSYVTKWDAMSGNFENLLTVKVHNNSCSNFNMSFEGFYLAIASDNGHIKSLNTRYMQIDRSDQFHKEKPNYVEFTQDTRFILTCDNEGSYCFIPNMRAPGYMRSVFQYMVLFMMIFYFYRLIMETWFE